LAQPGRTAAILRASLSNAPPTPTLTSWRSPRSNSSR
jgi:hypothetical protein